MWASLDLPSRTPQSQRNPSRPKRLSASLLTRLNCPYTVDHLASHHLTPFPAVACVDFCSPLLPLLLSLFYLLPEEAVISLPRPAAGTQSHTAYPRASSVTHYTLLLLDRAKEGLPRSPHNLQLDHSSPIPRNDGSPVALHHRTGRVVHTCTDLFSTQPAQHAGSSTLLSSCVSVSVICCRCTSCSKPALTPS